MLRQYPKHIKRLLRQYLAEAYQRELHRELAKLDKSFAEWRNGLIGSDELSQRVHRYETGPARELYKRYNDGPPDMTVAYAIVTGILQLDEVSPELLEAIERPLGFYQMLKERGELREPDDF
jgi:hypothetical protein